jgi:hypothetical protein
MFNGQTEQGGVFHTGSFVLPTQSGAFRAECNQARTTVVHHAKSVDIRIQDGQGGLHVRDSPQIQEAHLRYACSIAQPSGGALRLTEQGEGSIVQGEELNWKLVPLDEHSAPQALAWGLQAGYVLFESDIALGVVNTSYASASVTIARKLSQGRKDLVAVVAAALLLRRDML